MLVLCRHGVLLDRLLFFMARTSDVIRPFAFCRGTELDYLGPDLVIHRDIPRGIILRGILVGLRTDPSGVRQ